MKVHVKRSARLVPKELIKTAILTGLGVPEIYGQVSNLGEGGMFVEGAEAPAVGTGCMIRLIIDMDEPPVMLNAQVVHIGEKGFGVAFTDPDPDSISFIQGLLAAYQIIP